MKNRWLLNIALAVLVAALLALILTRPGIKPPAEGAPLTALTAEAIDRIVLQRPKQPPVVLEKSAGLWRMTAPRPARANEFRINELTRLAATRVQTAFPAVTTELAQYGLDKPLATVTLNQAEIRFGSMHPLNNELYVLHDNRVQLVPAALLRAAAAPLEDLLSASLLEDKLKLVSLKFPGFMLQQNAQGAWVRTPEIKALSSDRINRFVDEWRYARALSMAVASGMPSREKVLITVADADDGKPRTIEFGITARKPGLVLTRRDEGLEYHFAAEMAGQLLELRAEEQSPTGRAPTANP